jgi:dihydromonapterin reductase/dihydrofolate reductase
MENVVLITGAGQRVGLHLVRQFLANTGYPVVITYRTHRDEIDQLEKLGVQCDCVDFNDSHSLDAWLNNLPTRIKSIRAIIHNASIWVKDEDIDQNPNLAKQLWQVHVLAPLKINQALRPLCLASTSNHKDIIYMTDAFCQKPKGQYVTYLGSKSAMQQQAKSLAIQYAPDIKVNDIAPGLLMFHFHDSDAYRQQRLASQLLPIEPGPEVIWQAVQYFMNSPYSTGVSLPVDGGVRLC